MAAYYAAIFIIYGMVGGMDLLGWVLACFGHYELALFWTPTFSMGGHYVGYMIPAFLALWYLVAPVTSGGLLDSNAVNYTNTLIFLIIGGVLYWGLGLVYFFFSCRYVDHLEALMAAASADGDAPAAEAAEEEAEEEADEADEEGDDWE